MFLIGKRSVIQWTEVKEKQVLFERYGKWFIGC